MKKTRPYRTADEWQSILQQWHNSELSASAFCKAHNLGYASFCQWRQRLADQQNEFVSKPSEFIDLSPLTVTSPLPGWHLCLRIGAWLEFRVQR